MSDFDEVKSRINILDLIKTETSRPVKKVGINVYNLEECPFCGGHECFRINTGGQYFNCFQCDAGGSVFNFIQDLQRKTSYESLVYLAEFCKYPLENSKPVSEEGQIHQKIFEETADYYYKHLLKSKKALTWLSEKRGHTIKTVEEFRIGFGGSKVNGLFNHLVKSDFAKKDILASGLVTDREGAPSDFLPKNVFIYPHLIHSKVSHFTFKDPRKKVQYQLPNKFKLNGHLFYGQNAFYHDSIVLVEGENDRITAMHVSGESNIAATLGQLSQTQIDFIKQFCRGKRIYCCFDEDPAGRKYTDRVIDALAGIAQVFVIRFPEGKDIDEYLRSVKKDPAAVYFDLLDQAVDGLQFQIECLPAADETIRIGHILQPILERISRINDHILIEGYLDVIKNKYPKSSIRTALKEKIKNITSERQIQMASRREVPKDDIGIFELNNCYFRKKSEGATFKMSDFVIKLRKIFVMDDELHYECILKNIKNEVSMPVVFSPEERAGIDNFSKKCIAQGSFYFYGQKSDMYRIWQYEENQANIKEIIHYIQKYGNIEEHGIWLFGNGAIKNAKTYEINQDGIIKIDNKGFKTKDVLVYSGDIPTVNFDDVDNEFKKDVISKFRQMIDDQDETFKAYLALGFVAATVYLREIAKKYRCFPFFYPYGPTQTGKSATTGLLLSFFGFDGKSEPWQSATPDGTFKFMEQLSCLPAWYDEFINSSDRKFEKMLGITKNIYNRIGAGKGGIRKRQINVVNGTMWISGEDSPMDKGLLSRCVIIRFTGITDRKTESYNWLCEHQNRLSSILVELIRHKKKSEVEELLEGIDRFAEHITKNGVSDFRTAINYAIPAAAFWLFNHHDDDEKYMQFVVEEAKRDKLRKEEEGVLVRFFRDVSYMVNKALTRDTIAVDEMGRILYMCFNDIYNDWVMLQRQRGTLQIFKPNTILDYLTHEKYYEPLTEVGKENRYMFGKKRKRAIAFRLSEMPLEIREYFEPVKDEFE